MGNIMKKKNVVTWQIPSKLHYVNSWIWKLGLKKKKHIEMHFLRSALKSSSLAKPTMYEAKLSIHFNRVLIYICPNTVKPTHVNPQNYLKVDNYCTVFFFFVEIMIEWCIESCLLPKDVPMTQVNLCPLFYFLTFLKNFFLMKLIIQKIKKSTHNYYKS